MHKQRKVSNGEEVRKNEGGEEEKCAFVTAKEHSSVCNSKHT